MDNAIFGFDGTGDDVTVVVANRVDGGEWRLVDRTDPAEIEASVRALAARATANLQTRPPVNPPLHQLVSEWTKNYCGETAKPFNLSDDQRRALTEGYARLAREGRLAALHGGTGQLAKHVNAAYAHRGNHNDQEQA